MPKEYITLPKGVAVYPRLNRPDTKFDELGAYKADVKVPAAEAEPIIKKLRAIWKDHTGKVLPKSSDQLFKAEVDDDGEETGFIIFNARVKNKMTKAGKLWDRRPAQIDAKKRPIKDPLNVWGGSVIRPQCEVYRWQNQKGISLQPVLVQIIDLVTGDGDSAGDPNAFDAEEGFSADDIDTSDFDDESANESEVDDDVEDDDY